MNANAKNELESIKRELDSIIKELESISNGVRYDFSGIGNVQCADSIDRALEKYYDIRRNLNDINASVVADSSCLLGGGGSR